MFRSFFSCSLSLFLLFFAGCQNGSDKAANKEVEKRNQQSTDSVKRLTGKWKIDVEETKSGWNAENLDVEQLTRMYVDELTMGLQFNTDRTLSLSKNERTQNGFWDVKSQTDDSVTIEAFQDKTSDQKAEIKFTFQDNGRLLYQSKEMGGKDKLIFVRVQ